MDPSRSHRLVHVHSISHGVPFVVCVHCTWGCDMCVYVCVCVCMCVYVCVYVCVCEISYYTCTMYCNICIISPLYITKQL